LAQKEGRYIVTMNVAWLELYQAALLELRPEELRQRIDAAEEAIHLRIAELGGHASSAKELHELGDALRRLRLLARTECKPLHSTLSGVDGSEVAS
jgi:glutathionyl-hydroquinone reductase